MADEKEHAGSGIDKPAGRTTREKIGDTFSKIFGTEAQKADRRATGTAPPKDLSRKEPEGSD